VATFCARLSWVMKDKGVVVMLHGFIDRYTLAKN
jgi:hypothetical protein